MKYRLMDDTMRGTIAEMYRAGCRVPEIAAAVGLHETSVDREINRGLTDKLDENGRFIYDPDKARLDAALARRNKGKLKPTGDGRRKRHEKTDDRAG